MAKANILGMSSLILAVFGCIFSIFFQSMAYWGPGGSFTWTGFWVGAILCYLCSISSIVCMFFNRGENNLLGLLSFVLILASTFWTTFIIIAWQSGM